MCALTYGSITESVYDNGRCAQECECIPYGAITKSVYWSINDTFCMVSLAESTPEYLNRFRSGLL